MRVSIRSRVALGVLIVVVLALVVQTAFVLARVASLSRAEKDGELRQELAEVVAFLHSPQLEDLIDSEVASHDSLSEVFYEIRDPNGDLLLRTPNVPPDGLPSAGRLETGKEMLSWEAVHPQSLKGHRRIRIAETRSGGYTVRVAESLGRAQKRYYALRGQLAVALVVVALGAAWTSYLVASRALSPLSRMTERAEQLGGDLAGELPRSGAGDEIDRLSGVLNALLERVRAEMGRMRRLTAEVGHALRTPLAALRGTLELRLGRGGADETDELADAVEEIDRLVTTVNQLLLLEKLELTEPRERVHVDVAALAEDVAEFLRVLALERGIELDCQTQHAPASVDPDQLRQCLTNLIDNAIRYAPEGGRVTLSVAPDGDQVECVVRDSGPGLSPGDSARAFGRFYSGNELGTGIGLGLPIAKAIARAHDGDLRYEEREPGRFGFVLQLPLAS